MIVKVKNTHIGSEELKSNRLDTSAWHALSKSASFVDLRIHQFSCRVNPETFLVAQCKRNQNLCVDHCDLRCAVHSFLLAIRARKQKLNRVFFWGHDPVSHVRRVRYLTVHVGDPSPSVSIVILIVKCPSCRAC